MCNFNLVARGKVPDLSKTTCKEDPQCSIFGDNSYCSNKKCACKNGSYWEAENQFCWGINKVGEDCLTDKDCHPSQTHAICKENEALKKVCTCENGYHLTGESCRPDAKGNKLYLLSVSTFSSTFPITFYSTFSMVSLLFFRVQK